MKTLRINDYLKFEITSKKDGSKEIKRIKGLVFENSSLLESFEEISDFLEYFNCFCLNFLSVRIKYEMTNSLSFSVVKKENIHYLRLTINLSDEENSFYFSKLECKQLLARTNRVIARCDIFN